MGLKIQCSWNWLFYRVTCIFGLNWNTNYTGQVGIVSKYKVSVTITTYFKVTTGFPKGRIPVFKIKLQEQWDETILSFTY